MHFDHEIYKHWVFSFEFESGWILSWRLSHSLLIA
jgi:hypothetical protein